MNTAWLTSGPTWQTLLPGQLPDVLIRINADGSIWPADEAHFARNLSALNADQQVAVMREIAANAVRLGGQRVEQPA